MRLAKERPKGGGLSSHKRCGNHFYGSWLQASFVLGECSPTVGLHNPSLLPGRAATQMETIKSHHSRRKLIFYLRTVIKREQNEINDPTKPRAVEHTDTGQRHRAQ